MGAKVPFEAVVTEHGPTVLRVVRAVLERTADAEDAWSETFLAALRAYPVLPADANLEAWLVTVARRKAIDVIRARARHAVPVADFQGLPELMSPDAADGRDLDLAVAVGRLPARQRLAVVHHHLAGLPYAEVAGLVGGTEAAARRAAADGIATLRRIFQEDS